jgi:hypothetical protein
MTTSRVLPQIEFFMKEKFPAPDVLAAHNAAFEKQSLVCLVRHPWICTWKTTLCIWLDAPAFSNRIAFYDIGWE